MEILFTKVNPTENMTILVESPVPRRDHARVAEALMAYGSVYAEQVGFIEEAGDSRALARLQMMGGEFCGNATMSMAAFLVWRRGGAAKAAGPETVPLEVSGMAGILDCRVTARDDGYRVTVAIPPPRAVERRSLPLDGRNWDVSIARLDGIVHVVVPVELPAGEPRQFALRAARAWEPLLGEEVCGILLFDRRTMRIDPLIHVKSTATTVWERGCGSGSAAVGAWLAHEARGPVTADIAQPGGVITVDAAYGGGAVTALAITGNVLISARGTAYIANQL